MAQMDQAIRRARRALRDLTQPTTPVSVTDQSNGDCIRQNSADAAAMA